MRLSFMKLPEIVIYLENGNRSVAKIFKDMDEAKGFFDKLCEGFKLKQYKTYIAKLSDNTNILCHQLEDLLEHTSSLPCSPQGYDTILYLRNVSVADRRAAIAMMPRDVVYHSIDPVELRKAKNSPAPGRLSDHSIPLDQIAAELNVNPPRIRSWCRKHLPTRSRWYFTPDEAMQVKRQFKG